VTPRRPEALGRFPKRRTKGFGRDELEAKARGGFVVAEVQKAGGSQGGGGLADVVGVILDKGIVIDAWVRVAVVGLEIITIQARVVIASVDTYLRYAEAVAASATAATPA
jgi:hypothetical protein